MVRHKEWEAQEWQSWSQPAKSSGSTESKVQQWWDAKASKNYSVADRIRAELRAQGVDPDEPYHSKGSGNVGKGGGKGSKGEWDGGYGGSGGALQSLMAVVPMLQRWCRAKEEKDYTKADRIRETLRAQGINPDDMGDLMGGGKGGGKGSSKGKSKSGQKPVTKNYPGTQSIDNLNILQIDLLTQWFVAKDQHNFDIADGIRAKLREHSIEPADCYRPGALDELNVEQLEDLIQWYAAQDAKNYELANGLREKLRASGINPNDCPRPGAGGLDEEAKELLREWNEAMAAKNFGAADGIRIKLRAKGVEPAQHSRKGPGGQKQGAPEAVIDEQTNAKLDEWDWAMKAKDFGYADTLRTELRALGVEASTYRRPGGQKRGAPEAVIDDETNAKLDEWDFAMKAKNFGHADTLRTELRAWGIEASKHRRR